MGIMLVYDITSRRTFDNIQRWMGNIQSLASTDVEKLVVANKSDMEDRRAVSLEEGMCMAKDYRVDFLETSAKTGVNVAKAFETLTLAILRKSPPRETENPNVSLGHRLVEHNSSQSSCSWCPTWCNFFTSAPQNPFCGKYHHRSLFAVPKSNRYPCIKMSKRLSVTLQLIPGSIAVHAICDSLT